MRDALKLWIDQLLSVYAIDEERRRRGYLLSILIVGASGCQPGLDIWLTYSNFVEEPDYFQSLPCC